MGNSPAKISPFGGSSTAEEVSKGIDLHGKTVLITGCNTGIGKETARVLYGRGANIVMASRNSDKNEQAREDILAKQTEEMQAHNAEQKPDIVCMTLDLSSLASVRSFVEEYINKDIPLHYLILNAGVMVPPLTHTEDGFELQMGTNHFAHFSLCLGLLKHMAKFTGPDFQGRIVVLSSEGHRYAGLTSDGQLHWDDLDWKKRSYSEWAAYGQSKLSNILFTKELQRRLEASGVNIIANCLHPGVIATDLGRHSSLFRVVGKVGSLFMKNIPQGAATTVFATVSPLLKDRGGLYLKDCNPAEPTAAAQSQVNATRLWEISEERTGFSWPFEEKKE